MPAIKQRVDVLPKKQPVGGVVCPTLAVRANMGRIQNVKDVRMRDGTLAFVEVGDDHAKCPLAQARKKSLGLTEA